MRPPVNHPSDALPHVTVVMPAFNATSSLSGAINAVIAQTERSWELIVVDDGSTDGTRELAEGFAEQDSRIQVVASASSSGSPAAPRNCALQRARARFVAFLDADDIWHPEKIERQLTMMRQHRWALSCTGYDVFATRPSLPVGQLIPPQVADYKAFLMANTAGCLTVMLDRQQVGDVRFPLRGHEDYALWLSLLRKGFQMHGLPDVLASYRQSPTSVSSQKRRNLMFLYAIYHQQEGFSRVRSMQMALQYAWRARRKYASASVMPKSSA